MSNGIELQPAKKENMGSHEENPPSPSEFNFDFEYTNIPIKKAKKEQRYQERKIVTNKVDMKLPTNKISTSKYNALTFLPRNTIEQFSKVANIYFLLISIMQCITVISTSNGVPTTFLPLFVIFVVTAFKDLYEDIKRHRADSEENNKPCTVLNPETHQLEKTCWHSLRVGNIIKLVKDEFVPADILLIQTSDPKGQAFIETKNLDGETNLKQKAVPKPLLKVFRPNNADEEFVKTAKVIEKFEAPNPYLYIFNGSVVTQSQEQVPLDANHFVLRGCSIRNTDWVYGLVTYTGHETKIMLNSVKPRTKHSKVERLTNIQIIIVFILQIVICIFCAIWYAAWFNGNDTELEYLDLTTTDNQSFAYNFGTRFGTWMIIFSNFVPISLIVTLEMVKFIQGHFISKDQQMFHLGTQTPTVVQSSNLNEELGQIEYIFSDKTGTLTQNYMEFKKLIAKGTPYGLTEDLKDISSYPQVTNVNFRDAGFIENMKRGDKAINDYLIALAVCHTIITEVKDGEIIYNAASPDELALVNFAKFVGCEYVGLDDDGNMTVAYKGKKLRYKLLQVLEFNSKRKRMSVLVEDEKGDVILYTKGADSLILERMRKEDNPEIDTTMKYLSEFADEGLRTLLVAYKKMTMAEYDKWAKRYLVAATASENRLEKMEALQEEIETNLLLIGATAIEDKLQDDVGGTIAFLKKAGIKVWVLTGDKIETAINIGFSCNLLTKDLKRLIIDGKGKEEVQKSLDEASRKVEKRKIKYPGNPKLALIASGDALIEAMHEPLSKQMMDIADYCEAVICCRVAPKQKAEVVHLVRKTKPKVSTLAIGDGANDVNMITAAHVGIGIRGVEGQQAARASDYAFGEFKFLKRLLVYHGRESYRKNSILILYNFFKNVLLVLPIFWLGFDMVFSGQVIYDNWLYSLFNVCYTSLPIIFYAIIDMQFSDKNRCLMEYPALYEPGLKSRYFNTLKFWLWFANAIFQSAILGEFSIRALEGASGTFVTNDGYTADLWIDGALILGLCVVIINFKIFTFSYSKTPVTIFIVLGSIGVYIISLLVVNYVQSSTLFGHFADTFSIPNVYWASLIILTSTTGLDIAIERYNHLAEARLFRRMKLEQDKKKLEDKLVENKKDAVELQPMLAASPLKSGKEVHRREFAETQDDTKTPMQVVDLTQNHVRSDLRKRSITKDVHTGYAFSQEERANKFRDRQTMIHPQN